MKLFEVFGDIVINAKKAIDDLSKVENKAGGLDETFKKVGKNLTSAGEKMTKTVTAPLMAIGGLSAKLAIDFESAFAGVVKTVDATDEQLAELKQGIRDMAKEIPASANSIAEVAESAGQLGIETENIMGFTRTMIDLGEATNLSSDEAASSFARFANIVGMSQKDFDKLGSVVVALGNNLATTEAEIVGMGMRLAGAGAQIGLTEAEIMGFAGALSSVGIEAEAGGSAFSKLMINMQLASETGSEAKKIIDKTGMSLRELEMLANKDGKAFKALAIDMGLTSTELRGYMGTVSDLNAFADVTGQTAEQFAKAFKEDATGAIGDFIKGLATAEERGLSAIAVLDGMGITEIRLRDALLRAAGASDVFADSIDLGNKAWEENNALTNEAEQRYKTTASQLAIAKNYLKDVGITMGEIIVPYLVKFAEGVKNVAEWFSKLSPSVHENILKIGALIAVIGPVITIVGKLATAIGVLGGPITLLIVALGLLIGKIVTTEGGLDSLKNMANSVKDTFLTFKDELIAYIGEWANNNEEKLNRIKEQFNLLKENINNIIQNILGIFGGFEIDATGILLNFVGAVADFTTNVIEKFLIFINGLLEFINQAIDYLKMFYEDNKEWLDMIFGTVKEIFELMFELIYTIINKIKEVISKFRDDETGFWAKHGDTITEILKRYWESMKIVIESYLEMFKNIINVAISLINGDWEGAWNYFKDFLKNIFDMMLGIFETWFPNFRESIVGGFNGIKEWFSTTWQSISDSISAPFRKAKEAIDKVTGGIQSGINKAKDGLGGLVDKAKNSTILTGLASGTRYSSGGLHIVGEKGPELLQLPQGSKIYNNKDSQRMMGQSGFSSSIVINKLADNINVRDDKDIDEIVEKATKRISDVMYQESKRINRNNGLATI